MLALVPAVALLIQVIPLERAHAHNDYAQAKPLVSALSLGFCSIEADVYLVGHKLLVGHDEKDLRDGRDLTSMYLAPLAAAVRSHGGSVFDKPAEVTLLVDIKRDGDGVYAQLKRDLVPYQPILSTFRDGIVTKRAITVILSGERPIATLALEPERWAFIDGRPAEKVTGNKDPLLTPLISASWGDFFKWNGDGPMPPTEEARLLSMVRSAHSHGQRLRFWGTADARSVWETLYDAGVDLIGSDRQPELAAFLRSKIVPIQ